MPAAATVVDVELHFPALSPFKPCVWRDKAAAKSLNQ